MTDQELTRELDNQFAGISIKTDHLVTVVIGGKTIASADDFYSVIEAQTKLTLENEALAKQLTTTQQALDTAVEALKPFARVGGLPTVVQHPCAGLWSYRLDDEIIIKITAKDCIAAKAALAAIKE